MDLDSYTPGRKCFVRNCDGQLVPGEVVGMVPSNEYDDAFGEHRDRVRVRGLASDEDARPENETRAPGEMMGRPAMDWPDMNTRCFDPRDVILSLDEDKD